MNEKDHFQVVAQIEKFLNSNEENLSLPYTEPYKIVEILKELGFTNFSEIDTNGWDHDFWMINIQRGDVTLTFSGSWYYGRYNLCKENN